VRLVPTAGDATFSIGDLPPGRYYAVALSEVDPSNWADPSNFERLRTQATLLVLLEAETHTLALVRK
jgi:hypothetical protein